MEKIVYFNFYGYVVQISSVNEKLLNLLEKDFHFFKSKKEAAHLEIILEENKSPEDLLPKNLVSTKQSFNSITYDQENIRYNNYYGDVLSVYDYDLDRCHIYYKESESAHEVCYLVVLSRQGKWGDLNGMHKLHAMGITSEDKNLILMMPMKGGKTTMFTQFVTESNVSLLSDDTPLVTTRGEVLKFPIRFGVESLEKYKKLSEIIPKDFCYSLMRKEYGKKDLVDIMALSKRLEEKEARTSILIQGVRTSKEKPELIKISKIIMFYNLIINMIVGFGLPMVVEYFLRNNLKEHLKNIQILIYRSIAAINLLRKSSCYKILLCNDINQNYRTINELLKRK